jgi:predicted Zn-dependent peptidase
MATAVKATYFLDAVHEGLIYRFSYASISGDDEQAFQVLSEIARNLYFYENGIDLEKLQQRVMEGKGY